MQTKLFNLVSVPANADYVSLDLSTLPGDDRGNFSKQPTSIMIQIITTSLTNADAVVKIQDSLTGDPAQYIDVPDANITLAAGSSSQNGIRLTVVPAKHYRLYYSHGTNTGGALNIIGYLISNSYGQ